MGEAAFAALPDALRIVHAPRPWLALAGRSTVAGPRSVLACLAAALFRLPASGTDVPVRVTIEAVGDGEVWRRDFGGQRFRSRFRPVAAGSRPAVEERFGPFAFRLALAVDGDGLRMRLLGWRCGPVPLPLALAPRTEAREWLDSDGRFRFDVTVALPLAGHLVGYSGWLRPERP